MAPGLDGGHPALARALNITLHALVIAIAFVAARLILQSAVAAGLATLAFALTPKAPAIAVLWISARGELLMALFSLTSIAAWIMWTRKDRAWWLIAALAAYGLALLSKETATLLPFLLLLTPRSERPFGVRAGAVTGFVVLAVVIFAWRSQTGALTPFAGDAHYSPAVSVALWVRNATNYAGRMIVAPLALLALLGLARFMDQRRDVLSGPRSYLIPVDVLAFAAAFVVVFLAPVLPISLRSELYLYLPVFGVCLSAGWLGSLLAQSPGRLTAVPTMVVAVAVFIVALGGYQIARARDIHRDLLFSEKLVNTLRNSTSLANMSRSVLLIPSDRDTERSMQSAIGGYLHVVLQYAFRSPPRTGIVQYSGEPARQADTRLLCSYRQSDGTIVISPAP